MKIDFKGIATALLNRADFFVSQWLPDGEKAGHEWKALNPRRNDNKRGSFSVNLNTGVWSDFATGDSGADMIDLYAYLNGMNLANAAKELEKLLNIAPAVKPDQKKKPAAEWEAIVPVPADAPHPYKKHVARGEPQAKYTYYDAAGALLGYVYRFIKSDGNKEIIPQTYWRNTKSGVCRWRWAGFSVPRPLYGLEHLNKQPGAKIIIVEGEKCVDVARELLPQFVWISWPGGGKAVDKVDFSPLAGRKIVLWPDADDTGKEAMVKVMQKLAGQEVKMMCLPESASDGWDVADAILIDDFNADDVILFIKNGIAIYDAANAGTGDNAGEEDDFDWQKKLMRNDKGALLGNMANAWLILRHDLPWRGVLAYDEFSGKIVKLKPPPYFGGEVGEWYDSDVTKTLMYLQMRWKLNILSSSVADEAARAVAWDNRFHAVREWVKTLPEWDKTPRLEHWLADVYGAEQNEYTGYVGRSWLVSAVARIMQPGCKVDEMVVLESDQGGKKSTSLSDLVGAAWYLETSENPSHKDFYISLAGKLVVEISEMQSFTKADLNQVKMAVTRRDDTFRAPYDKYATSHLRQCIFVGTTNSDAYLRDATGGRRFLPIKCGPGKSDVEYIRNNRLQMWAEAVNLYHAGFKWWDFPKEAAKQEQDDRFEADPWEDPVLEFLKGEYSPEEYPSHLKLQPISKITGFEILRYALKVPMEKHDRQKQMRVTDILRRNGWKFEKERSIIEGKQRRVWVLPKV